MYSKLLVLCYFEVFNTLIVDIFRHENSLKSRAHLKTSRNFTHTDIPHGDHGRYICAPHIIGSIGGVYGKRDRK